MRYSSKRWSRALFALVAAMLLSVAFAACGGDDDSGGDDGDTTAATAGEGGAGEVKDATLVLDFLPGPVHAGIYYAVQEGYYEDAGINLRIIEPTSTADTLKLIDAGQAQFGIADGIDVANQIDEGRGAKGILALTQRPSGGLITLEESGYSSPADLDGATIGVTGVPSDDAILETVLADGGLTPQDVKKVTIGFNGVQNLENKKVDGFVGFIPADGVQMEVDGFPITSFAFDEYGGPQYPGLVVFSTEDAISEDPDLMQAFVGATIQGYEAVIDDPDAGAAALLSETTGMSQELVDAGLAAYEDMFVADAPSYGVFQEDHVADLMTFLLDSGLVSEEIATDRYYTNEFAEGGD